MFMLMFMKTVSTAELRADFGAVVGRLRRGEAFTLTYRRKPLARLTPLLERTEAGPDDPFYRLHEHADAKPVPLSNEEIDSLVYGRP
jgi:antitoxin (DNA-binding transcriptional repressor) of toxin-antitoxin stability system